MSVITDLKTLYTVDDVQWLEEMIQLLKNHQFEALDLENLIEELEDLGSEKRNAVVSLLEQVMRHLLLLEYWTTEQENNSHHWQGEIYTFRVQLKRRLTTNLRNYLASELESIYQDALGYVKIKTQHKITFPQTCPYSLIQLLDIDWLPQ
ncbi:protein of unknown function DUF29 [Rippkaea orientalis PCC 8801]|uniref:DUF29 domain-containing protein n=1 Tax=Rippkaea orientalis (strain PCC 8801 / RF-1) TaxID=41431 RepID=B7JZS8_RIPO1|nr:DUF29 domain-containing protein [Rippkaea orientalis]ACK65021.1 protein of unknown function DUF29 [Rippkaea orientalis PCC 8801]